MPVKDPKISIVIPTYNRGGMLADCISSATRQEGDFEILIIDNASQDNTREVVDSFDDPRIRYVYFNELVNIWGNHNRAIGLAEGDYIVYLHSDDAFGDIDNLWKVFELATEEDFLAMPAKVGLEGTPTKLEKISFYQILGAAVGGAELTAAPSGMIYSHKVLKEFGGFRIESFNADRELLIPAAQQGVPTYTFDGCFIKKETWDGNLTMKASRTGESHMHITDWVKRFFAGRDDLDEILAGFVRECERHQVMKLFRYFHHADMTNEAAMLKKEAIRQGKWQPKTPDYYHAVLDRTVGLGMYLKIFRLGKRMQAVANRVKRQ
ncbi:glycosyltransferase family 2 protein [bacterium]|nr:glycosyltransferase family 2 protein [bacterium]